MRRLRVAILGESPCDRCVAACCKQNGHDYAVLLRGEEVRRFAAFAQVVTVLRDQQLVAESVLPYVNGRCQFLDEEDRCRIYEDRPLSCRQFQCITSYNQDGMGRHGLFLRRNPKVRELIESL
jgi:Fe-S-cluster containining protein